jgi:hypothetical protein
VIYTNGYVEPQQRQISTLLKLSTIHMGQMMPSEPSNILFWTYQDMMEWMSRTLV